MTFRYLLTFAAALGLFTSACKTPQQRDTASDIKYYGYDNQRYRMQFDNSFLTAADAPNDQLLDEAYESLQFLFGVFQWHQEFVAFKGIPHQKPAIKILRQEVVNDLGTRKLKVHYRFDDEVVFNKTLTKPNIDFWMPRDRTTIYSLGMVDGKNACTDDHYWSEGDFWYFWNPEKEGCPETLKDGLNRVNAKFAAIPNTLNKYPLYGKLGANKKRLVYIAHGINKKYEPDDAGSKAFAVTLDELKRLGFAEAEIIEDGYETKQFLYKGKAKGYDVEIYVGLFNANSIAFLDFGRQGLSTADVFIYNGHSGLGGYLPPSRFEPLSLPDKYQIFLFNGCSTFAYYNGTYFDKKKATTGRPGSEKLEIVTTGLEAWFRVQPYVTGSLVNDLLVDKNYFKWEQIITNLYHQTSKSRYGDNNQWKLDPKKFSAHYQVNGDEDNPSDLATALKEN